VALTFPKFREDGMVEPGDGTVWTRKDYDAAVAYGKKKCADCGHDYTSHFGQCRYVRGTMACRCQNNYT